MDLGRERNRTQIWYAKDIGELEAHIMLRWTNHPDLFLCFFYEYYFIQRNDMIVNNALMQMQEDLKTYLRHINYMWNVLSFEHQIRKFWLLEVEVIKTNHCASTAYLAAVWYGSSSDYITASSPWHRHDESPWSAPEWRRVWWPGLCSGAVTDTTVSTRLVRSVEQYIQ